MKKTPVKESASQEIDRFLARLSPEARATLEKIRSAIRAAAPQAEEGFSYGVPAFRHRDRPIAAYAAAKHHCSYFPMSPAVITAHASALKGYELSKGAIRFPMGQPLPAALVRKLVRARLAELESGGGTYRKKK
jgi:uncharacterized protein YdhG (YjbR/CyaY superfamily)